MLLTAHHDFKFFWQFDVFSVRNFEFISTLFVFYKITYAPRNYTYRVLYTFENMKKRRFFAVLYK